MQTCFASSSRARRDRRVARRTSISSFPASRSSSRIGATSIAANAVPSRRASQFLRRYTLDTLARLKEFSRVRARGRVASVIHGDMREEQLPGRYDGVLTSPPYPGLIDYHEQHRYAYELLGLDDRRELEVGAAAAGNSRAALAAYSDGIVECAQRQVGPATRRSDLDRRERPPRALPGDPGTRGASPRRTSAPPCEPAHRTACR